MIVTERDESVLLALARYFLLNIRMIQRRCFANDKECRVTRRRLQKMCEAGLVQRHRMLVASIHDPTPAPVFVLTPHGCGHVAMKQRDSRFVRKPTKLPHVNHLFHHLAMAEVHIMLDQAIAGQDEVTVARWINEFDVINDNELDSRKHFRLFAIVQDKPRVTCSPDAAFMLNRDGQQLVFYVELERGGTGAAQLVARKAGGYRQLAEQQLFEKHFPETTVDDFHVLLLAPTPKRRDTIRRAFREADPVEYRTDLWRFVSITEITPETFLHADIFYTCDDQPPRSLVRL